MHVHNALTLVLGSPQLICFVVIKSTWYGDSWTIRASPSCDRPPSIFGVWAASAHGRLPETIRFVMISVSQSWPPRNQWCWLITQWIIVIPNLTLLCWFRSDYCSSAFSTSKSKSDSLLLLSLLSLLTGVGLEGTCNSSGILRSSLDVCFHIWTMKFIAAPNELL